MKVSGKNKIRDRANRQVIVTGVTGFIGQHLAPVLLKHGYEVVAIIRDIAKARQFEWCNDVKLVTLDFHKDRISFKPREGASLIHLAWQGLPNYQSPSHLEENLPKSFEFIKQLILAGVEKILVTGTCFEYGMKNGALDVSTATAPENSYALAKDKLRESLSKLKEDQEFSLKWARLFYMYGKGQNPGSILAQLDTAIKNGDAVFNMSGGEQLRDYLPIESVVHKLVSVFESEDEGCFNICSGEPISIRRLVENRIKELGASININLGYFPYSELEPMAFWGISQEREND